MEEESIHDDSKQTRSEFLDERNVPEEVGEKEEKVEAISRPREENERQADGSMVMLDDYMKPDNPTLSDAAGNKETSTDDGENHGAVFVGHPNGGSTENAESTESFEFANGSDETSSWESFSG